MPRAKRRKPRPDGPPQPAGEDTASIWSAHTRAHGRTREAAGAAQRIAANNAKQKAAAETLADRAHAVAARAQELSASFTRVNDTFERMSLVALNAGLEGARLGEASGKALLLVSDEVRSYAARGGDSARELSSMLAEIASELTRLHAVIGQMRQASVDASQDASLVATASAEAERALAEMAEIGNPSASEDAETARAIAAACEQAQGLLSQVGALDGKVSRSKLATALHPVLEPLTKLLGEGARTSSRS
jgi:methyl-accepting chemotaxis protein